MGVFLVFRYLLMDPVTVAIRTSFNVAELMDFPSFLILSRSMGSIQVTCLATWSLPLNAVLGSEFMMVCFERTPATSVGRLAMVLNKNFNPAGFLEFFSTSATTFLLMSDPF